MEQGNHPTFANGKVCYIEIPAIDISVSAAFYKTVFDWHIRHRSDGSVAFDDGASEVSGTWVTDRKPAKIGILIHLMVDDIHVTMALITANGGKITQPVGMDAPEITARFSDPAGNIFGIFQQ
ncbi:VOC family protein [Dyadobacter sp. LHD-138]|uniref:VOC family protein n=1 Tax=Dyadobacter sp. LHD-138 TaxID=3071413 RepID=UPI0027DFB367|nr:VOC family protein [Dyadobacter sp. LHD-138]MDQ6481891.1 VOC family protein [Dyadobacter sp. LHD-138]